MQIDEWAPCVHSDEEKAVWDEKRAQFADFDTLLFILVVEGDVELLADQWVHVAWIPWRNKDVRVGVTADTFYQAVVHIVELALEHGWLSEEGWRIKVDRSGDS